MKKFYNDNEIDNHTIIFDSGVDSYCDDDYHDDKYRDDKYCDCDYRDDKYRDDKYCDCDYRDDKKKLKCIKKDADCCFDIPEKVFFDKCQDKKEKTICPVRIKCQARLLKINVVLKKVCKGRKVALGVLLLEDKKVRGFKGREIIIPGDPSKGCVNVKVTNFCFVLPEKSICDKRKVDVKVIAHYADLSGKRDRKC